MYYRSITVQTFMMVSAIFALLLTTGCATVGHLAEDLTTPPMHRKSVVYAGTKYHLHEIPLYSTRNRNHWASDIAYSFRWWHYIDLPLCLCADTVMLPYTIPRTWYSRWKSSPDEEEIAIRPYIIEYSACIRNMRDIQISKQLYAQSQGLDSSQELPRNLAIMENYSADDLDHYVCPAGGEYSVGGHDQEPSCSVHGPLSVAKKEMNLMYKEHRLPERAAPQSPVEGSKQP